MAGLMGPPQDMGLLGPPAELRNAPEPEPERRPGVFERMTRAAGPGSLLNFIGDVRYGPREEERLANEALRENLRARQRLPGVLSGEDPATQEEMLGLLGAIAPDEVAGGLLGQFFPEQSRTPTPVIQAAQFAHPDDPAAQRDFVMENFRREGADDQTMRRLEVELRMLQLDEARRQREQSQETEERARRETAVAVRTDIQRARRLARTNRELAGTFLGPGQVLPDLRRSGTAAFIEGMEALGFDQSDRRRILTLRDNFNKDAANFLIESLDRMQGTGTITNQKFEALRAGVADLGTSPQTNAAIIADGLEALLVAAEIEDVSGVDHDEIRTLIQELRAPTDGMPGTVTPTASQDPDALTPEEEAELAELEAMAARGGR